MKPGDKARVSGWGLEIFGILASDPSKEFAVFVERDSFEVFRCKTESIKPAEGFSMNSFCMTKSIRCLTQEIKNKSPLDENGDPVPHCTEKTLKKIS